MGVEAIVPDILGQAWQSLLLKPNAPSTQEWPAKMRGGLCWGSASFRSEEDFTLVLNYDEVCEVRTALQHFNSKHTLLLPGAH